MEADAESSKSVMQMPIEEEFNKRLKIAETEKEKKFKLKTRDGVIFEVEESIVMDMGIVVKTIMNFRDMDMDMDASTIIELPNVTSRGLSRILDLKLKGYDEASVNALCLYELRELLGPALFLNMKDLVEILCRRFTQFVQNNNIDIVIKFFNSKPEDSSLLPDFFP